MSFQSTRKNIKGELHSIQMLEFERPSSYIIQHRVEKIIDLLNELKEATSDEDFKVHIAVAAKGVFHTNNKEVSHIEYAYDKMHKRNAAKVRKKEYDEAFNSSMKYLKSDLHYILNVDPKDMDQQ